MTREIEGYLRGQPSPRIDIAELRAKYPNPVKTPRDGLPPPVETYCVGGALALEMGFGATWGPSYKSEATADHARAGWHHGHAGFKEGQEMPGVPGVVGQKIGLFPEPDVLATILQHANRELGAATALKFAHLITEKNDEGNFETAWAALADALGYGKEGWTPADDESVAAFLREATV